MKNLIIDGTNIEFRVFHTSKNLPYTDAYGAPTACVFKFLQSLKSLAEKYKPNKIYIAWDKKLKRPSTNFRQELLNKTYKAGRTKPDDIQDMYDQEKYLIECLDALGCVQIYPEVMEADDIVGWLVDTLDGDNVVVSADSDLLQLVRENTKVWNLKKEFDFDNFQDEIGVEPEKFVLYKSIMGDTADNIPGLPGYGKKRSKTLAERWEAVSITDEFKHIVERNIKIIDLSYGYTVHAGETKCYESQFNEQLDNELDINRFENVCCECGLTPITKRIDDWNRTFRPKVDMASLINSLNI
jgi:DNA polymerase-1